MAQSYWIETLGCPKNQVDSDKLVGTMAADGLKPAASIDDADLVVVNTCAFVEEARQESIDTILSIEKIRSEGSELVVTGCLAERYPVDLAAALPEVDRVAGFGVPVTLGPIGGSSESSSGGEDGVVPSLDLLELPRPKSTSPWAYIKIAEGCDRNCGFCAIPTFRGKQRSRSIASILAEVEALEVSEVVLVAQDLAAYGRDQGQGERQIVELVRSVADRVPWVRLLYLYPSDLSEELIETICETGVPYFDLSLQHVSRPLLRGMRRWGSGDIFTERIERIRAVEPSAAFRSNFIVGYPGETEDDHDQLLSFVEQTQLDWCGFFSFSREEGTHAYDLDNQIPSGLMNERLGELRELQDRITSERQDARIGSVVQCLVDEPGVGRTTSEAPEIDGIVRLPQSLESGQFVQARIVNAEGPDLIAEPIS